MLSSDLIKSSSEERSLLKNLGSWLGKFTIGRNQALRAKEIDPKSLIIEVVCLGLYCLCCPFFMVPGSCCHTLFCWCWVLCFLIVSWHFFFLLLQAYERGLMIAVIPFTSKVCHLFRSCDDTCYPCTWHVLHFSLFTLCADFGTLPVKYCISTSKPMDHGYPELACWDIQSAESQNELEIWYWGA